MARPMPATTPKTHHVTGRLPAALKQVLVIPRFIEVVETENMRFIQKSGTGHLVSSAGDDGLGLAWVTVSEVLRAAEDFFDEGVRIWKSDTDGYDIEIASLNWEAVFDTCCGMWLEWDIFGSQGTLPILSELIERIAGCGLQVLVFDNFGQPMFYVGAESARELLEQLSAYLDGSARSGVRRIYYCDIWILPDDLASLLWRTAVAAMASGRPFSDRS